MSHRPSGSSRPANTTSSVRRNLFHHHLSRRPTTTASGTHTSGSASTTSTSATTTLQDPHTTSDDSSGDIVVRNKNGDYRVELPPVPAERMGDEGAEREKEEARVAEAVKHHCRDRNRTPSEPAELLAAVQAGLRSKVAALHEDNWMFEGDGDS